MNPLKRPRITTLITIAALAATTFGVVACTGSEPDASFDPAQPCAGAERQLMQGAYPELEARLPASVAGQPSSRKDSGRFCAQTTLGTLWDHGITEIQFGGAIFAVGDKGGVQATVFRNATLTAELLAEEYKTGASKDSRVTLVSATTEMIAGRPGYRLNYLNGDSRQAIVIWPSRDGAVVHVVIGADVSEAVVQSAIDGLG